MQEQAIRTVIDNSSVFTPGNNQPQLGFRRSELIAQGDQSGDRTEFNTKIESGITVFHFSVQTDPKQLLNFKHEYQPLFIEPKDGSHVFDLQTGMMRAPTLLSPPSWTDRRRSLVPGTPFNTTVSDLASHMLRIRSHDTTALFQTPFEEDTWHNFAVAVDWDKRTLQVYYSTNADPLQAVTAVEDNSSAPQGLDGQGDFHFGLLKVRLEASILATLSEPIF